MLGRMTSAVAIELDRRVRNETATTTTTEKAKPAKCACVAGVFFEAHSGRVKACPRCRCHQFNGDAREFVKRLLDIFAAELAARGGTTEDVLARLAESPGLLVEANKIVAEYLKSEEVE